MHSVIPLDLPDGTSLLVEVTPHSGFSRQGTLSDVTKNVQSGLQQCFTEVGNIARLAIKELTHTSDKLAPSSVELSFSLKAAGGSSWILLSGTAEATLSIKAVWAP